MLGKLFHSLKRTTFVPEAFFAYYNRLPERVEVNWERDGEYFIGRVKAGEYEFMTQGKGVKDFIDMVNDAVCTVYDIPVEYDAIIQKARTYMPDDETLELLWKGEPAGKSYSFMKSREVLRHALA